MSQDIRGQMTEKERMWQLALRRDRAVTALRELNDLADIWPDLMRTGALVQPLRQEIYRLRETVGEELL